MPWSVEDAAHTIGSALVMPHPKQGEISDWNDDTINRIVTILKGEGEAYRRDLTKNYRAHVYGVSYGD